MLLSRTYERNAAGEPDKITKEDGTYTRIEYDDAGRVKAERYFDDVDTLLDEVTYLYDLDGNRTQRTSSAGVEDYIYESGSRLTQVLLDGVETQRFEYDENGRVKRIVRDGLDQRLSWDALDRLERVDDQNFVEEAVDFAYDGQGRRVSADRGSSGQRYVVGPTGNQSLESPHLVHNGAFLTGELVYNGEHALWRYQGDGTLQTRVYLRDAMGSVIGLMDENGQLIETFDYDAFGNVRSPGGEALPEVNFGGDSRFQGMWKDAGTGLYYVRARYYDPRTGRFLSRDPAEGRLEQPESFMPYAFANGNPYVYRDPTGLFTTADVMATVNAISAFATVSLGSGGAQRFLSVLRTAIRPATQIAQQVGAGLARVVEVTSNVGLRVVHAISRFRGGGDIARRTLTRADLGVEGALTQLKGTFEVTGGVARVRVDMVAGTITNPLQIVRNLAITARGAGATVLRIEGTIANTRLYSILKQRYGLITEGATDVIEIFL